MQRAQKIYQTQINWLKNSFLGDVFMKMGMCSMQLQEVGDAFNFFKESLKIYETFVPNDYIDYNIGLIRSNIDECLQKLA